MGWRWERRKGLGTRLVHGPGKTLESARTAQLMGEINWHGHWIYNNEASIYEDIGYIIMDIVK